MPAPTATSSPCASGGNSAGGGVRYRVVEGERKSGEDTPLDGTFPVAFAITTSRRCRYAGIYPPVSTARSRSGPAPPDRRLPPLTSRSRQGLAKSGLAATHCVVPPHYAVCVTRPQRLFAQALLEACWSVAAARACAEEEPGLTGTAPRTGANPPA